MSKHHEELTDKILTLIQERGSIGMEEVIERISPSVPAGLAHEVEIRHRALTARWRNGRFNEAITERSVRAGRRRIVRQRIYDLLARDRLSQKVDALDKTWLSLGSPPSTGGKYAKETTWSRSP